MHKYGTHSNHFSVNNNVTMFFDVKASPIINGAIINILVLMKNDPFCYPPSYEKLSGDLSGLYSRRINRQHSIVYEVNEEDKEIHILRMWTHYDKL